MRKLIAICAVAVVVLVGIVLTSTANATILRTINIQNRNSILPDIGQLWGGGLASANCYRGIYSWTNAGASTFVTSDAGISSASSVMRLTFVNVDGILYLTTDTATPSAHMIAEYNAAASILLDGVAGPVDLSGVILTSGVHTCAATAPWTGGVLTMDGQFNPSAQWGLQNGIAMTTPADVMVSLINSASANNVFWKIGSSLTLRANSAFAGNIIANTSITLKAERGEEI
jgi:hypothetical protein